MKISCNKVIVVKWWQHANLLLFISAVVTKLSHLGVHKFNWENHGHLTFFSQLILAINIKKLLYVPYFISNNNDLTYGGTWWLEACLVLFSFFTLETAPHLPWTGQECFDGLYSLSFLMIKHCFITLGKLSSQAWLEGSCAMKCSPKNFSMTKFQIYLRIVPPCAARNLDDPWSMSSPASTCHQKSARYQPSPVLRHLQFPVVNFLQVNKTYDSSVLRLLMMLFSLD